MEPTSVALNASSETVTVASDGSTAAVHLVLRPQKPRRTVKWTEDVVDNEHMNKKKSNSAPRAMQFRRRLLVVFFFCFSDVHLPPIRFLECCLYQKPRQFGESDSEDECDSDLENCHHGHNHDHGHGHEHHEQGHE